MPNPVNPSVVRAADLRDTPSITADGRIIERWLITVPSLPTVAAGAAAGGSPTLAFAAGSTDIGGQLQVLTGSAPGAGIVCTVTFANTGTVAPSISVSPANANVAALAVTIVPAFSTTTTTFVVTSAGAGLAATTQYNWFYTTNLIASVTITPRFITKPVNVYGSGLIIGRSFSGANVTVNISPDCANNSVIDAYIEGLPA